MKKHAVLAIIVLFGMMAGNLSYAQSQINIIPYPNTVLRQEGFVDLNIVVNIKGNSSQNGYLQKLLAERGISVKKDKKSYPIYLQLTNDTSENSESYALSVTKDKIEIKAPTETGLFYGMQSLNQLLLESIQLPLLTIKDTPAFKWRAFMLDESRHFHGAQAVKDILDEMALLKLNTFHWHLTNDQGWRIEIKKYPLLTEIGSKRDSTQIGTWPTGTKSTVYDRKPYGGFYTQEQIKDIIQYAAERHITIVPEIAMPGHASAAIAAYPWLGVKKDTIISVPAKFGVMYDIFDVSDERVRNFLKDVLEETMALFPSKVIHIGGDEVRHNQWKESKQVNDFMKENDIASYAELQVWFTNEISRFVERKGKRVMGWNEIMGVKLHDYVNSDDVLVKQPLAKNAIVHFWKGDVDLITDAVKKGHDVVNSYHNYTYLDYDYNKIPLSKSYSFEPIPAGLPLEYQDRILGLGCQMWSEWTPTLTAINKHIYPRLAAYAEVGWTRLENKDFQRFEKNIQTLVTYWNAKGLYQISESTGSR